MREIVKITIKGESGYCSIVDAYRDKVTITNNSIAYEYKPYEESDENRSKKWTYRTDSPIFRQLFSEVTKTIPAVLSICEPFYCDIGSTTFVITYADKAKEEQYFCLPGHCFKDCFSIIQKMIPGCEEIPEVIQYYEYNEDDE